MDKCRLENYHIPLIIYSPMLKAPVKFEAVSCQINVTPSLIALLRENYNLTFPKKVHWFAGPLDTSRKYQNTQSIPMMRERQFIKDYLHGDYFISYDDIYKVKPGLEIEKFEDEKKLKQLKEELTSFNEINKFVCNNNKILPGKKIDLIEIASVRKPVIDNIYDGYSKKSFTLVWIMLGKLIYITKCYYGHLTRDMSSCMDTDLPDFKTASKV